jgi:hypothetical protein
LDYILLLQFISFLIGRLLAKSLDVLTLRVSSSSKSLNFGGMPISFKLKVSLDLCGVDAMHWSEVYLIGVGTRNSHNLEGFLITKNLFFFFFFFKKKKKKKKKKTLDVLNEFMTILLMQFGSHDQHKR